MTACTHALVLAYPDAVASIDVTRAPAPAEQLQDAELLSAPVLTR